MKNVLLFLFLIGLFTSCTQQEKIIADPYAKYITEINADWDEMVADGIVSQEDREKLESKFIENLRKMDLGELEASYQLSKLPPKPELSLEEKANTTLDLLMKNNFISEEDVPALYEQLVNHVELVNSRRSASSQVWRYVYPEILDYVDIFYRNCSDFLVQRSHQNTAGHTVPSWACASNVNPSTHDFMAAVTVLDYSGSTNTIWWYKNTSGITVDIDGLANPVDSYWLEIWDVFPYNYSGGSDDDALILQAVIY